ncbi:phage portal protein [Pseudodesulfovibrio pelocollis]|uniref:phage portal protein n=1 Tax=Pseudodesulfovibrio pelocollis TaxID=3051432 RepID=UPI00255AB27F|nr:phage portal protein [Pseudodesulfovibrio sp. SB368]
MDLGRSLGRVVFDGWTSLRAGLMAMRSPRAAMAYVADRRRYLSYKAASKTGANRAWRGDRRSADATIALEWRDVVARARDLAKNSPYVSGALEKICDNVVFTGIRPQFVVVRGGTMVDIVVDRPMARKLEKLYKRWAKAVWAVEAQELGLRHLWTDGEYLIHFFVDPSLAERGLPPINFELLEADHLDSSVHGDMADGHTARRGIEYDASGHAVAYHLFPEHPGGAGLRTLGSSRRIDARSVEHVYAQKRISQSRGISWLASIIMWMRNFEEYQDSEQIAMRLLSAFGFVVETPYPEDGNPMGGVSLTGEAATDGTGAGSLRPGDFINPGQIVTAPVGSKVSAVGYDRPGSNYEPWVTSQLRGAAAGAGVAYETFTGDLTKTTYSGGRHGKLVEQRAFRRQQAILNREHNDPIIERFIEFAQLAGLVDLTGCEVETEWLNPGWPWVDPRNDAQAAKLEYEMGITTLTALCAARGLDFEEITAKRREELDVLAEAGFGPVAEPAPDSAPDTANDAPDEKDKEDE